MARGINEGGIEGGAEGGIEGGAEGGVEGGTASASPALAPGVEVEAREAREGLDGTRRGWTPLHRAAGEMTIGALAAVEARLAAGADVNARTTPGGQTPLMLAMRSPASPRERFAIVEALLGAGAQVDAVDDEDASAVAWACWALDPRALRRLFEAGAPYREEDGELAFDRWEAAAEAGAGGGEEQALAVLKGAMHRERERQCRELAEVDKAGALAMAVKELPPRRAAALVAELVGKGADLWQPSAAGSLALREAWARWSALPRYADPRRSVAAGRDARRARREHAAPLRIARALIDAGVSPWARDGAGVCAMDVAPNEEAKALMGFWRRQREERAIKSAMPKPARGANAPAPRPKRRL